MLKNFDLFRISSSISVHLFSQEELPEKLINQFQNWHIKELIIHNCFLDNKKFQKTYKKGALSRFTTFFNFMLPVKEYLTDHPESANQILRQRIFTGSQYFTRSKSWETEVFHFFSDEPEIINILGKNQNIHVSRPDHIFRAYFTSNLKDSKPNQLINVTEFLDKKKGTFKYKFIPGRLLIIRRYSLNENDKLENRFNFFEVSHFKRVLKIFNAKFKSNVGTLQNMFIDFDLLLTPEYQKFSFDYHADFFSIEKDFLEKLAAFWLSGRNKFTLYKNAFNRYFQMELRPIFEAGTGNLLFQISAANPLVSSINLGHSTLLRINENRFEPGTPYYFNTLVQVKRAESRRLANGSNQVPVAIHQLHNVHYSFAEKMANINQLLAYGVNHFHFSYDLKEDDQLDHKIDDPGYLAYSRWFSRLHQIGYFMKQGVALPDLLILNPEFDEDSTMFHQVIDQVQQTGLDYSLIDFDIFNSEKHCKFESGLMLFEQQKFKIILLPAVKILPLATLQKLRDFMEDGGFILSVGRVPDQSVETGQDRKFKRFKHNIWFEGDQPHSTSFKEAGSGGKSYYQADIELFPNLINNLQEHLNTQIVSEHNGIRYRLRETSDNCYLFITNTNSHTIVDFEFISKYTGRPYEWDFSALTSIPYAYWFKEKNRLHLNIQLQPTQSKLFVLNKKEWDDIWQIRKSDLKEIKIEKQSKTKLALSGYIRKTGKSITIVQNKKETREIQLDVSKKLPLLTISPKEWYLKSEVHQGPVNLGNFARLYPYFYGELSYSKLIIIEKQYLTEQHLNLNLGNLKDWCSLFINDEFVSGKLDPPWDFNITDYVKNGENKLTIKITNTISNIKAKENNAFKVQEFGLFGPVKIIPSSRFSLEI